MVLILVVLLTWFALPAEAHHRKHVLGDSTSASDLVFPPVTSGTGLLLPDSPLFFLDQLKQSVRLFLASAGEERAKLHQQIAGERMAELRVMMSRNNMKAVNATLINLQGEMQQAAQELTYAAARGKQVTHLAKELNDTIKLQRHLLDSLAVQSNGGLKLQLQATRTTLKEPKIQVEDQLSEDDLHNEIQDGLEEDIQNQVVDASLSAQLLENTLTELKKEALQAAEKSLKRRADALKKIISEKNNVVKATQQRLLTLEEQKQQQLLKLHTEETEGARQAIIEAQQAAMKLQKLMEITDQLKNTAVETTTLGGSKTPVNNSSSASSKNM